jgi:hypothetical protein
VVADAMCVGQIRARFFPLFLLELETKVFRGKFEFVREDRWMARTRSEIEQLTSCRGIGATSLNSSRMMEEAS